jgi:SPP1 gp7 family putative phage head morphogenesis protein
VIVVQGGLPNPKNPQQNLTQIKEYSAKLKGYVARHITNAKDLLKATAKPTVSADGIVNVVDTIAYKEALTQSGESILNTEAARSAVANANISAQKGALFSQLSMKKAGIPVGQVFPGQMGPTNPAVLKLLESRNIEAVSKLTSDINAAIMRELTEGVARGEGIPKLAERIRKATGFTKARCEMIARTETSFAFTTASVQSYKEHGIQKMQWWTATDDRVCPICAPLHTTVYTMQNFHVMPAHPNCRCVYLAVPPDTTLGK